ncbi:hypothetical protein [Nostoc flagelliforme]
MSNRAARGVERSLRPLPPLQAAPVAKQELRLGIWALVVIVW